jgi:epoxyqueuosine reductase
MEAQLLDEALRLGLTQAGIAAPEPADGFDHLVRWLGEGMAGEMTYLHETAQARRDPRSVYPPVQSVLVASLSYSPGPGARPLEGAKVARYAQTPDYHRVMRERLKQLAGWMKERWPGCWGRVCVDTAPLLERDFARRAGLGWFGKNTMLIHPRHGSWLVLGAILTDLPLTPTPAFTASHCGTCTACLDACPTDAFPRPYVLDARKCISYLTIEVKGAVPGPERIGSWLFGCDVCQDVCPWNRKAPAGPLTPLPHLSSIDPEELLALDERQFRTRFEGTALYPRPGRAAVLRNAAIVLGNTAGPEALPALRRALEDVTPIREAAKWAIQQIQGRSSSPG